MITTSGAVTVHGLALSASGLPSDFSLTQKAQIRPWDDCLATLRGFFFLENDWNGDGAAAPRAANVYSALAFVEKMRHTGGVVAPRAVPGVNGEVLLVWKSGPTYLEAEIRHPGLIEWTDTRPE